MKSCAAMIIMASLAACQPQAGRQVADAAPAAVAAGDPARGFEVADRNCSLCHAIARDGASPHPKAPAFRALASRYPLEGLGEALAEGIVVGHSGMPQIELDPKRIDDLITYLKTLQPAKPD